MTSVLLNVFRCVLWPRMWSVLMSVPCELEKNVYSTAENKLLVMQSPLLFIMHLQKATTTCVGLWVGKRTSLRATGLLQCGHLPARLSCLSSHTPARSGPGHGAGTAAVSRPHLRTGYLSPFFLGPAHLRIK